MAKKILIFRSNDTDLLQPPVKQSTKLSVYQFMATRTKQVFNALLSYNFVAACAPHQVVHTVHPHKPRHQLCILKTVASSCCLLWRLLKLANLTYAVEFRNEPGSPLTFWSQCQARGYAWRIFFYPWIVAVNYSISPSTSTPNVFSRPLMYVFFIVIWRENVSVVIRQTHERLHPMIELTTLPLDLLVSQMPKRSELSGLSRAFPIFDTYHRCWRVI